jgi:hypothetical protein
MYVALWTGRGPQEARDRGAGRPELGGGADRGERERLGERLVDAARERRQGPE